MPKRLDEMTSAELDAAFDEAFGPEPENPYAAQALAEDAEFYAENLATVLEVSIETARGMVEIVDGRVVIRQAEFDVAARAADPVRVQERHVALFRRHRQESAYQYALIQRRTNASGSPALVRIRTSRPRERRAVHGRRRRASTTRDDGAEPPRPALAVWGSA